VKTTILRAGLIAIGIALMAMAAVPGIDGRSVVAAPLLALTPTPEPPTLTPMTVTPGGPTVTPGGPTVTPPPAKPPAPPSGTAEVAIVKSVNVATARIGDEIIFTLVVSNIGTGNAEDVQVTDAVPDFLDVIEATTTRGNVSSNGRTVMISIGRIAPGEDVTITIRARVNERAKPPGGRNVAVVSTSSSGDDPNNNTSGVDIPIPAPTPTAQPLSPSPLPQPVRLPRTGVAAGATSAAWPLVALGLGAILLSLLIRRRDW
jgi:uncharacterized repeat protein (TIGR01451 family)